MYKNIQSIISKDEAHRLSEMILKQPFRNDDEQVEGCVGTWYSLPFCNILLGQLCERLSKEVGRKLLPTYTYCRIYTTGNQLFPHLDRPSCEWSVTVNLSQTDQWPIYMDGSEIVQEVGDGAIYQGCEVYHWRKPFKGQQYVQVFLHYVDAAGPYKDYVHESSISTQTKPELTFKLLTTNPNIYMNFCVEKVFSEAECDKIINCFRVKNLTQAGIGHDSAVDKIRNSRIFWIPKYSEYAWIYERILNVVSVCNGNNYKFDLTGMEEELQFTEYDEEYRGNYGWHIDGVRNRKLSVSVQLSDPATYEGGQLQFDHDIASNKRGTLIIFPSFIRHQVTEVTKGCRYALVTWIAGPPFR